MLKCCNVLIVFTCLVLFWSTQCLAREPLKNSLQDRLTAEEKQWIADHPVINVRISRDYPPFEFFEDGQFKGVAFDYLSLVASRTGLQFVPTPDMPWEEALQRIEDKDGVDLVLLITHRKERERFLDFTQDYITFPEVIFTRRDKLFVSGLSDLRGRVVATENGFISAELLKRDIPSVKLMEVETTEKALQAVALGQADAYIGNLAVGSYLIEQLGLVDLKIAASARYEDDSYAMGVRKDWPILAQILEKSLEAMSIEDHRAIKQKWFVLPYEHGIHIKDVLMWVFLVAFIALAVIFWLNNKLNRKLLKSEKKIRAILNNHYQLTGLISPDGKLLMANKTSLKMVGASEDEVIGKFFWDTSWWRHSVESQDKLKDAIIRCARGEFVRFETTHLDNNGNIRNIDISFTPLCLNEAGKVDYIIPEGRDITELKETTKALQESEFFFRSIIEDQTEFIVRWLPDGIRTFVNDSYCEFFEQPREKLIGTSFLPLISDEDRANFEHRIALLTPENPVVNGEHKVILPNGETGWQSWTDRAIFDANGKLVEYQSVGRDITEKKLAEQQLKSNEEYFRTIFQACPDTIALVRSEDALVIDFNDVALDTFGFKREGIPEDPSVVKLDFWEDPDERDLFLNELKHRGRVDNFSARLLSRDGRAIAALISARSLKYNGEDCHLAFIKDISIINEANDALRDSESMYRRLSQEFEAVLDGIVDSLLLIDKDRTVVWGNRGAALQFGYRTDELVGKKCQQLWGCSERESCSLCVDGVFATGKTKESVKETQDAQTWGIKGYPVFGNDGQVQNVIQIASNLTEKIQLREEAARSTHLAALGGLSAGIAHEINNPTGLILMALPFVRDSIKDILPVMDDYFANNPDLKVAGLSYPTFREEILHTIEDLHGGAQRVKRIVDDLKDFAREKSGSDDEDIYLEQMIKKSMRLLHNVVKNSTDNFVLDVATALPAIKGSSQRLEQVLVNLIQNACQSLEGRNKPVTLKVWHDEPRQKVVLQVSDEGCGIPAELVEKITDPFFTTRREAGGTGLGLSVSTRIIEEHGGTLSIDSEVGKGSTFTIELPVGNGGEA